VFFVWSSDTARETRFRCVQYGHDRTCFIIASSADLAEALRAAGGYAGQVIITGALHPLTYVEPGTRVVGDIEGFGRVEGSIV
jgi:hypothetical protein